MITATRPESAPPEHRAGATASAQLLAVDMDDGPHSLMRVLMTLHRRSCVVTSVDFASPDRHFRGRLVIGISAPRDRAHCVAGWLANVVEVRAVEVLGEARPSASAAPGSRMRSPGTG